MYGVDFDFVLCVCVSRPRIRYSRNYKTKYIDIPMDSVSCSLQNKFGVLRKIANTHERTVVGHFYTRNGLIFRPYIYPGQGSAVT